MGKKLIVIADTDKDYLTALELRIAQLWGEEAEIEVITQFRYFNEFFSRPRDIYLLVINEYLYSDNVKKQNFRHLFILTEEENNKESGEDKKAVYIYKYLSVGEIIRELSKTFDGDRPERKIEKTRLYTVYSACGGCGKTLTALGIASRLGQMGRKVLYMNLESIQDFDKYMTHKQYAGAKAGYAVAARKEDAAEEILREIQKGVFDYVLPFEKSPLVYQMTEDTLMEIVRMICLRRLYDSLVVDVSRELTREKMQLFEMSDKTAVVCMQTADAVYQTERFLENMLIDSERWIFVCGRYREGEENVLKSRKICGEYTATEYVPEIKTASEADKLLEEAVKGRYFDKTVYMLEE